MIQKVEASDIPRCVKVIRNSFLTVANEYGFTPENASRFTAFSVTEERLLWQMNTEHRLMYAFYADGSIVGYYSLLLRENADCELNNLCVLPSYRHRGIGEALLRSAFDEALKLGCIKISISIVEENIVLRKWYEAFGFIHIKTEKYDFFPFTCGYMEKILDLQFIH